MDELAPAIAAHHARALNPSHPHQRGTAQGPDVYMQAIEAANPFHRVRLAGGSGIQNPSFIAAELPCWRQAASMGSAFTDKL